MGIEFDKSINSSWFVGKPDGKAKAEEVKQNEITNVPVGQSDTKELGRDLLNPLQPRFVELARIPETDAAELNEMYNMAGIKNLRMPTVAQYASVAGHVATFEQGIDELTTTNNAQQLFDSPEFATLDKLFGLE